MRLSPLAFHQYIIYYDLLYLPIDLSSVPFAASPPFPSQPRLVPSLPRVPGLFVSLSSSISSIPKVFWDLSSL